MKKEEEINNHEASPSNADEIATLRAENEQLRATSREREANRQITEELTRSGARSPELLYRSIKADLQFADDGSLVNSNALIAKLKADNPEQFGQAGIGSVDGGSGTTRPNALTKATLARMKPDEIAKLDWAEVRAVLAAG